jgi:dihydrofolate reductase
MTLDGVVDAPSWTMDDGFPDGLAGPLGELTGGCSDILLGRVTYEMFAPAWSTRTVEEDPGAPFFNDSPKHVVSSTLTAPTWKNTQVLGPYDADAIRGLKDGAEKDVYVSGSIQLVKAMLDDGLVDQLHLVVYPLTLDAGLRLFTDVAPRRLVLARSEAYDNGVVYLNYRPRD